ncbi:DUF637 domain-containing protein [Shewanella sp. AS16]|uniref:DUF637 domain-containing protein n=1 Tax=Shewanella sp. AS16 TaxID=2907625 RepID=UPI001F35B948|nr:DUF637 domain-containing protein [Shewanella sp. AS16]MCE9687167.1 DUF637 domain-containing protein [Shewanella sp. AS16]
MSNKVKGDAAYRAPFWQRATAYLMSCLMLLQICLPTTVQAIELISDAFIASEMNSSAQFERVYNHERQFEKAFFVEDVIGVNTQTIESFHQKLLGFRKSALPSPVMIPILNDGITLFIPYYPLEKRLGDQYVQARFVRSQIFNLLNRSLLNDSYATEAAQINDLYNNAYQFSATSSAKFGDRLTRAQVNTFGHNLIWPETWLVNNEAVLVPVVHLTDATVAELLVNGHRVEFSGAEAKFNNITVNAGTIYTRRNTFLTTAGNFTVNEGASVIAQGDLNLLVGGTLQNMSGRLSAKDNVNIIAKQYSQKTMVHRYATRYEQGSRLGQIASVDALNGNVSIRTYGDIVVQGGTVSGNTIVLSADGNIQLTAQQTTYVHNERVGGFDIAESILEHAATTLTAQDSIYLMASGAIELNAASLTADQGVIQLLAEQGIYIANAFNQFQSSRSGKIGKVTEQEQEFQTIAIRSALEAGKGVLIASDFGDITLQATRIKSGEGTQINAANGKVNLLLAKEQDHYYLNRVTEGFWTIKTETQTDQEETAVYNSIIGGLQAHATHGLTVEFAQEEGVTLQDSLAMFEQSEDLAWMAEFYNDPEYASNIEIAYQELLKLHEYDKSSSLSPAAMAIIAIAMAVAMGPAGFGAIGGSAAGTIGTGTIGSTIVGIGIPAASLQAGALALATQAATSLASGNNVGETLQGLTSKQSITSLATSMVTAGVLSEVGNYGSDFFGSVDPNAPLLSADTMTSIGNQATQAVIKTTVSAGISTVINGGDFSEFTDAFTASLKQAGIQAVGQYLATSIGKAYKSNEAGAANEIIRYLSHAGAGCVLGLASGAAGLASGSDKEICVTGAGGAVVGELVADAYKANKLDELFQQQQAFVNDLYSGGATQEQITAILLSDASQNYFNNEVAKLTAAGVDLAKFAGGLSALVAGTDVNLAAMTAENAAQNNCFFLIPIALMMLKAIDISLTAKELYDIYEVMQTDPEKGQELFKDWMFEQAVGGALTKVIPGFKTFDELLDWLRRNDVLSPTMLKQIQENILAGMHNAPSGSITVHNAVTTPLDLKDVSGEFGFIAKVDGLHDAVKNDGFYGEQIAAKLFKDSTGFEFTDIVKNKSNNGADLLGVDDKNKTIWLIEVKSSQRDRFPNPNSLDLSRRGQDWIDQVATGTLWGQAVTQEAKAYATNLINLQKAGYTLKPLLAKVSVPAPGQSGIATVTVTPAS